MDFNGCYKAIYLHIINLDDDNFYDDPKPIA